MNQADFFSVLSQVDDANENSLDKAVVDRIVELEASAEDRRKRSTEPMTCDIVEV